MSRSQGRHTIMEQVIDLRADNWKIVRGPQTVDAVDDLIAAAEAGATLVVVPESDDEAIVRLTGVRVTGEWPEAEWFVTLADCPEAARLDVETACVTPLRTLAPVNGSAAPSATTSVRYEHQPTIVARAVGSGRVVTVGLVDLDAALRHPTVGVFLRRLGRPPVAKRTEDIGVAVVGYGPFGGMGYTHGLACAETEGLRLTALVDTASERLRAGAADFPGVAEYTASNDAVRDDAVDVAIIATPPVHHVDLAVEFLRAGKHVVVEKPMALTTADADRLLREAEHADRTVTVHQSRRWDRDYLTLRSLVDDGTLGHVFNIETFVGGFEHPCRAWHSEEQISGGAVFDWGSHHIDWILQLHGSAPSRVLSTRHDRVWPDTTNADQLSVWMQWADGREASFRQSDIAAIRRPKFYVQGANGTASGEYRPLRIDRVEPGRGHVDQLHHHAEVPVDLDVVVRRPGGGLIDSRYAPAPAPGWGFHRNLADHLLLGEPLAVRPEQSRDVVAVLDAAHRSAMSGGELIDLDGP